MSEKRKHQGSGAQGGDSKKKKKGQYFAPKGGRPGKDIPLGVQGFLLSCTQGREWQAGKEIVNVLEEAWEELTGKTSERKGKPAEGAAEGGGGVEAMLEEELGELRDTSKARFWRIDTGCKCLTFIKWTPEEGDPSPGQIVLHILEAAQKTKVTKTRNCSRIFPVEVTAYASLDKIKAAVAPLIERELPEGEDEPTFTFGIQYEYRANDSLDRKEVIDGIASMVPKRHKVDLNKADKTILVQIIKTTCTLSVLPRFRALARYNLQTLTDPKQGGDKGTQDAKPNPSAGEESKKGETGKQDAKPNPSAGEESKREETGKETPLLGET
ncbi:hypothetical protein KFL_001790020 [Klebsormidium nitens]|uniref:THUMP domain-containing protein n=1 Tax=Klebsormidium nitens TaxID=105231 RepID=A0A1Y1HZS9_KLENI|nr:hypothetical protein KFL_001790020 [Klebsormidium nitens]|eukprot:GAQ84164.1 hypothetical protein KFL_001790020 [Klebsormidium nitens]